MHVEVTGQAFRKHFELSLIVRFGMTFSTIRDLAVRLMAHGAQNIAMFASRPLPLGEDSLMAPCAGLHISVGAEGDLQRGMNLLMTLAAGIQLLPFKVTVVTFKAVGYVAMLLMVTGLTTLLTMGAGQRLEFCGRAGMTVRTNLCQPIVGRQLARSMRVLVAIAAVRLAGPVAQTVAGTADGHQRVVIILARAVSVEEKVTLLAGEPVFAASLLEVRKLRGMTLAAFRRFERLGGCCIKLRIDLW